MNADRYTVYGAPSEDNPMSEMKEITCNSELAARVHAAAFTADGYIARIVDSMENKRIPTSTQTEAEVLH